LPVNGCSTAKEAYKMNQKLPLPIFIVLYIFVFAILTLVGTLVLIRTEIPGWSLFHPLGVVVIFVIGFIDRFGPESRNKKFYEKLFSLTQRDKAIFGTGTVIYIFLGLAEPYIFKGLSDYQGIGLSLVNLLIWFGFTKLFGSQELGKFFVGR
jgi:hypothetical protein